jgi:hypothetical protein
MPQSAKRVKARCLPRGQIASRQRDERQQSGGQFEHSGIAGFPLMEEVSHQAPDGNRAADSFGTPIETSW